MSDPLLKKIAKKHDKYTSVEDMRRRDAKKTTAKNRPPPPPTNTKKTTKKAKDHLFKMNKRVVITTNNGITITGTLKRLTLYEMVIEEDETNYELILFKHAIMTVRYV